MNKENNQQITEDKPIFLLQVVAWNHAKYLPALFSSLRRQTEKRFVLCILDNDSKDQTKTLLDQYDFTGIGMGVQVLRNFANRGFGYGHNQILQLKTEGTIIGIINPDLVLPPDFLAEMRDAIRAHSDVWVHGPRLMRCHWAPEALSMEVQPKDIPVTAMIEYTTIVDSLGLRLQKSGVVLDRYTGTDWMETKGKNPAADVFGISGACLFFERARLPDLSYGQPGTLFHPDFFAYEEDSELAWRVQEKGGKAMCHLSIIGYHFRAMQGTASFIRRVFFYLRRKGPVVVNAYRNHIRLLAEHYRFWRFFPYSLAMVAVEFRGLLLLPLRRRKVLSAWARLFSVIRQIHKRRKGLSLSRVRFKELIALR